MSVKQRNTTIERGVRISNANSSKDVDGSFSKQAVHQIKGMNDKREHEKQELQVLNQRFSSYVERVRALEAMNRKLLAGIEDLKSKWGFDSSKIKDEMEPELLKVRESIDEVTRLKAISEIKAKRAESDALQFRHLMDLAMDCFNTDKNKIQNLENLMEHTKQDAEYLKGQLHDINEQIAKYVEEQRRLYEQLSQLKDDLDKETIDRVARQNEVQTLEEQISFLKAVHEQEVSELSRLQTIVGFDPAQFYRTELERAIRDIRGDFEQLNSEQKRELEEWYRIKTEEVEKQVAKEREFQTVSNTGLSAEESANMRNAHQASQLEYVELQRSHRELSARLRELEELLEQSKTENQIHIADRDREISLLREKIQDLMATYDELMSRKTSLEFEINTYRRLLECEETRISSKKESNVSSSSSSSSSYKQQAQVITQVKSSESQNISSSVLGHATHNSSNQAVEKSVNVGNLIATASIPAVPSVESSPPPRPQVSQRAGSTELSSDTITKRMQVQRTSKGPVGIKEISPDGKFVLVENTGKRGDQDISKWQLKRKVDNEQEIIYVFPANTIIGSGKTIKIWSRGQGKVNPPAEFVHDLDWRSGESMVTRLVSESGEERALYSQRSQ
jgi:intermediate filament protein if